MKPLHKLPTQPFEGNCLKKVTSFVNFQLVLLWHKFFLIKLCYALNAKYYAKAPSHNLERGKEVEEIASSFPYSQEEGKRESFGSS